MSKYLIEIKKLNKKFKTSNSYIEVLRNINIKIETGKLVALVGPLAQENQLFYI